MANARKVIMRTKVLLLDSVGTLEEETHDDYITSSSIGSTSTNGRWGGNSVNTDISSSQTGNWSSFVESENITWDLNAQNWEEAGAWAELGIGVTTTQLQLSTDTADLKFFYIKNTGSNSVYVSLDSNSTYPLFVSGGASTMFRGTSDLNRDEIYLKTLSGTSTVDYIIAG
tara:strand:- start:160 stop:672 length:513 start_codon:yes stop_codon:yes gene_type:complete